MALGWGMKRSRLLLLVGLTWLTAHAVDDTTDTSVAPAKPPADFKSLDTDGDGRISLAEFTAPARQQREEVAKAMGPTGSTSNDPGSASSDPGVVHESDGILSSTDTIEGRYSPEVFRQLDVNHDAYVSPAELEVLFTSAHNISQP